MIGARAGVLGAAAIGAVAVVFGGRAADADLADPPRALAREMAVGERVIAADAALAELQVALEEALEPARRGSALVVAGDEVPSPHLRAAAEAVDDARDEAAAAIGALTRLDGGLRALLRDGLAPTAPATPEELASTAAQLRASEATADEFAAMRGRSEATLAALEAALAALDGGDPDRSLALLGQANKALDVLRHWEVELVTLPIWIGSTARLVTALEALAGAVRAGDSAGAQVALARFETAAKEAREADVALRVAIAEGGAAVTAAPIQRMADALRATFEARAHLASILHPDPSPAP